MNRWRFWDQSEICDQQKGKIGLGDNDQGD